MGSTGARMVIKRITMFKVPKDEDIQAVLEAYDVMGKTAEKDGKPYILSHDYGKSINAEDPRNGGFTIIAQNVFASRDDVDFYDRECVAHKKLKMVVGPRQKGMGVQMFESWV